MALGTGPRRLIDFFESNWQASRTGRDDIPASIKYHTGNEDPDLNSGVLVVRDRQRVPIDQAKHDVIHCYHPEANPPNSSASGFKEERLVETVQVDISLTDRTDHANAQGNQRLHADERMTGTRGELADFDDAPYGGILGEAKYLLETIRRGLDEWDTVSHDFVNLYLGTTNADVSITVELEQIARNTVQS